MSCRMCLELFPFPYFHYFSKIYYNIAYPVFNNEFAMNCQHYPYCQVRSTLRGESNAPESPAEQKNAELNNENLVQN